MSIAEEGECNSFETEEFVIESLPKRKGSNEAKELFLYLKLPEFDFIFADKVSFLFKGFVKLIVSDR